MDFAVKHRTKLGLEGLTMNHTVTHNNVALLANVGQTTLLQETLIIQLLQFYSDTSLEICLPLWLDTLHLF